MRYTILKYMVILALAYNVYGRKIIIDNESRIAEAAAPKQLESKLSEGETIREILEEASIIDVAHDIQNQESDNGATIGHKHIYVYDIDPLGRRPSPQKRPPPIKLPPPVKLPPRPVRPPPIQRPPPRGRPKEAVPAEEQSR